MQKIVKLNRALLYCCMVVMFCLHSTGYAAPTQGKPVSITIKNSSLAEVLRQVSKKSGLYIYFQDADLAAHKNVTIDVRNKPVESVLHELLDGRGFSWVEVSENTIAVKKNEGLEGKKSEIGEDTVATITVTGKVVDEKGEPVIGATVLVKGGKLGTTTNSNGDFILNNVKSNAGLIITNVSFRTEELLVKGRSRLGNIRLKEYVGILDETVIIAYGTATKRTIVGNVGSIKAKEIERQPINNPLLALQGRIPGLFIEQSTGFSGTGVKVRIQGQNSIANGNDPLYVVDGVPYTSQLLPSINGILGSSGATPSGNPLSYLSPSDIESIEVLKDADATSIYGSRAANGAILITTKKGKIGKTSLSASLKSGYSKVGRKLDLLNSQEYVAMRREAKRNDKVNITARDYDFNGVWDTIQTKDWQDILIGEKSHFQDAQITLNGGSENTQFLIGTGYHSEGTVIPGDFEDRKISFRLNMNNASSNKLLNINTSVMYMFDDNKLPNEDITARAKSLAPTAPDPLNVDGTLNWAPTATGVTTFGDNPYAYLFRKYNLKTYNLLFNTVVSYSLTTDLDLKANLGYNDLQSNEIIISPLNVNRPEDVAFFGNQLRTGQYGQNKISSWIVEPQLVYKRRIGKGIIDVLTGTTFQKNISNGEQVLGSSFISDAMIADKKSAGTILITGSTALKYKYSALFGRLNYSWDQKYIFNVTARRDGSSRFGRNNRFQNFGSLGIAWIFSSEDFTKKFFNSLSYGKLRASYGTTGSDQIPDYQFLNLYTSASYDNPYQGIVGISPNGLTNPYLQWELTKKIQFGIDLGFVDDRFLLNATYFNNTSSNQLIGYALSSFTGFNSITSNFPATVKNSGYEFALTSLNVKAKNFSWSTSINFTIPQNKLKSFPNISSSSYKDDYAVGKAISNIKLYEFIGVNPTTGIYEFKDQKGNPINTPNFATDANALVNTAPKYYGGIDNTIKIKDFELNFLFQYVNQMAQSIEYGVFPGFRPINQPVSVLNRWQNPDDVKPIQRYFSNNSIAQRAQSAINRSDVAYKNGSYLKLRNISLFWHCPDYLLKKIRVQNVDLFLQAQNLLTFTSYNGYDPETRSSTTLPVLKTLSLGVNVKL